VAALSHWEVRAASAKQSLEALEQQAAAALAELEVHDANSKARQQKRQLLAGLKPPQFAAAVSGGGASLPAGFGVSRVLGGLPEVVGQLPVPDPVVAAAAVTATGLAAMQAVHHYGGHLLQNVNL
jgi:Asp/Glu/hydantoin racemase